MKIAELATKVWREWVKDRPYQNEDFAKGFMEGFNFCIKGQVKVSGGDKGELLYSNLKLQERIDALEAENEANKNGAEKYAEFYFETNDKLTKAKKIIGNLYAICKDNHYPNTSVLIEQAEEFLKEVEND